MLKTLVVAYEGNDEVRVTQENSLNRKYEHFFAYRNKSLTQSFNHFNFLINDREIFRKVLKF